MSSNNTTFNGNSHPVENGGGYLSVQSAGSQGVDDLPPAFVQSFFRSSPDADSDLSRFNFSRQAPPAPNVTNVAQARFKSGEDVSTARALYNMPIIGADGPLSRQPNTSYLETPAEEHPETNTSQYQESKPNFDSHSLFLPLAVGLGSEAIIRTTEEEMQFAKRMEKHLRKNPSLVDSVASLNVERSKRTASVEKEKHVVTIPKYVLCRENGKVVERKIDTGYNQASVIGYVDAKTGKVTLKADALPFFIQAQKDGKIEGGPGVPRKDLAHLANLDPSEIEVIGPNEWDAFVREMVKNYQASLTDNQRVAFMTGVEMQSDKTVESASRGYQDAALVAIMTGQFSNSEDRLQLLEVEQMILDTIRQYREDQKAELREAILRAIIAYIILAERVKKQEVGRKEAKIEKNIEVGVMIENAVSYLEYLAKRKIKADKLDIR